MKTTVQNKKGGTFLYKAPEHFYEGTRHLITPACDVWSWAIVINEMYF